MKPLIVISCPLETMSGYGARSRDIVKALLKYDKYDIKVISQRWGSTAWNALDPNKAEDKQLLDLIWRQPQLPRQPDVWIQITVPNEFQPVGKYNIGITAGIETTIVPGDWIDGVNRMDLNLVSSHHSKNVFLSTEMEKKEGNNTIKIKVEKPIEVLFEGANLDTYKPDNSPCIVDFNIPESFAYLFVGHWMQGDIGEDRKNVGLLINQVKEFRNKGLKICVRGAVIITTPSCFKNFLISTKNSCGRKTCSISAEHQIKSTVAAYLIGTLSLKFHE